MASRIVPVTQTFIERLPPNNLKRLIDNLIIKEKISYLYSESNGELIWPKNINGVPIPLLVDYYKVIYLSQAIGNKCGFDIKTLFHTELKDQILQYGISTWLSTSEYNNLFRTYRLTFGTDFSTELLYKDDGVATVAALLIGYNQTINNAVFNEHWMVDTKSRCVMFFREMIDILNLEEIKEVEIKAFKSKEKSLEDSKENTKTETELK
jgi:hypothetical protein